jgi:hypothetical protein
VDNVHRRLRLVIALCFLASTVASIPGARVQAQDASLPGVRGSLYESPSFGWIVIAPPGEWSFSDSYTENGADIVFLTTSKGENREQFFISRLDDGRGSRGCAEDTLDLVASSSTNQQLTGWDEPDFSILEFAPNQHGFRFAVRDPIDSSDDVLVFIECMLSDERLLIASVSLRSPLAMDSPDASMWPSPLWPRDGHTGQPRETTAAPLPGNGVVRFLSRSDQATAPFHYPFSCMDQESFTPPADIPAPGYGYLACSGQIANVDTVPATVDLAQLQLGCIAAFEGVDDPACPASPIPPSHGELLRAPAESSGTLLTLQPGESAEVVLWYTLPEGDIPLAVLFVEPDRQLLAGPTSFSAGTGSRPKVRAMR